MKSRSTPLLCIYTSAVLSSYISASICLIPSQFCSTTSFKSVFLPQCSLKASSKSLNPSEILDLSLHPTLVAKVCSLSMWWSGVSSLALLHQAWPVQQPSFSQTQSISLIIWSTVAFTSIVLKITSCLKTSDISSRSDVMQILQNCLCNIMKAKN